MICPTNQTVATDLNKSTAMVVWTAPVANDNSELIPTVTCNAENGSKFEIGETEVVCYAIDQVGNQANCSFIVNVVGKWYKYTFANFVILRKSITGLALKQS